MRQGIMQVTGYQIREAIRHCDLKLKSLYAEFDGAKTAFKSDQKRRSVSIAADIMAAELRKATLRECQAFYNQNAMIAIVARTRLGTALGLVGDAFVPLTLLINVIDSYGRNEKIWSSCVAPTKERYSYERHDPRDPEKEYAQPGFTREEAVAQCDLLGKIAGEIRAAIATANAQPVTIPLKFESLF